MQTISIIAPCYNEADSVQPFYDALLEAVGPLSTRYELEFIFVDDGSSDDTLPRLRQLATRDARVVPLQFVRNFGKEIATTAGLHAARGDAAITIDVDLQHPPELIPQFVDKWVKGADVVVGVRRENSTYASGVKRGGSRLFYSIMNRISDVKLIPGATDYRLVDRTVLEEFRRFTERGRMTRGLIDWLGYPAETIAFTPAERAHGTASYSMSKLIGLAFNSFVAMSLLPLKLAGYVGTFIMTASGLLGLLVVVEQIVLHDPMQLNVTGTSELGILVLFMIGMTLAAIGLVGLYVAAIHTEVINRPLYVIRQPRHTAASRKK